MVDLFPEGFEEGEAAEGIELTAYTDSDGERRMGEAFGRVVSETVAEGWAEEWRRFHRPVRIGPLWVGPPWEPSDEEALRIEIEPGRAFGTGAHPTTRLCLALLLETRPASLLDLGCGSGVIAIAAAKLGFAPVYAVDSDPSAAEVTRQNAAANAVTVQAVEADVLRDELPETEVAVANVTLSVVEGIAARLPARVLLASGYPARVEPLLPGWHRRARVEADGWAAEAFARA